ncbi:hypothetical protein JD81_01102 [Micromonospora sagamiensis]|uniref:Uncharacterized protein n=1 Tax=Micromonospora sagamiensis TaxID=47875 RepID=A0A562WC76_9ACTN|nr:hypothetical protein JD81_01102 [Micromonospora sagamiensis]
MPRSAASAGQLTRDSGWSGARCPETTVNSWATPRWVTGMPATAGTAIELVTPGTTVTGMPAAVQASSSSPPRPKTYGSPPLSRTTNAPADARSTRIRLISSWVRDGPYGIFEASTSSTSGCSSSRSSPGTSRSATTTSASASSRQPRRVISSASPGPAPTRATCPARRRVPAVASVRRGLSGPSSNARTASRVARERCGSPPPSTATVTGPCRVTAGVQALAANRSSARTQKIRRSAATALTAAAAARSSTATCTSHAPFRSAGRKRRGSQCSRPASTCARNAGVSSGETSRTSAPASSSAGTRRVATVPPPTTTTRRPASRSPSGYGFTLTPPPRSAPRRRGTPRHRARWFARSLLGHSRRVERGHLVQYPGRPGDHRQGEQRAGALTET